jgi:aspartyl-tRNA(Asn)/glutamyl-tRNA(Gln) amidotransferase subunit A
MLDGMDAFWRMRSWLEYASLPAPRQARVLPFIVDWLKAGATLSGEQVFRGYSQMGAMREAAIAAHRPFDFVLSPTAPVPAFRAELASPTDDPMRPLEHIGFTVPYNMSEQPAASINCGWTKAGLPIGLQIAGKRHDDLGVLQVSRIWEELRPASRQWPEPPGGALSSALAPVVSS